MFSARFTHDPRQNFVRSDFGQFMKLARLGIQTLGWDGWSFEGNGVELDPVEDLGIPLDIKLFRRRIS